MNYRKAYGIATPVSAQPLSQSMYYSTTSSPAVQETPYGTPYMQPRRYPDVPSVSSTMPATQSFYASATSQVYPLQPQTYPSPSPAPYLPATSIVNPPSPYYPPSVAQVRYPPVARPVSQPMPPISQYESGYGSFYRNGYSQSYPSPSPNAPAETVAYPAVNPALPAMTPTLPAPTQSLPNMTPTLSTMTPSLPAATPTLPTPTPTLSTLAPTLSAATSLPTLTPTLPTMNMAMETKTVTVQPVNPALFSPNVVSPDDLRRHILDQFDLDLIPDYPDLNFGKTDDVYSKPATAVCCVCGKHPKRPLFLSSLLRHRIHQLLHSLRFHEERARDINAVIRIAHQTLETVIFRVNLIITAIAQPALQNRPSPLPRLSSCSSSATS